LIKRAEVIGAKITNKFMEAARTSPVIGEVRGKGFMLSCELVKDKKTREPISPGGASDIMLSLRDRGVLCFACGRHGNVFRFMPPLTTTKAYFEKAVDIWLDILTEKEEELLK
jgi:4-aminobutyrate aminotransferase-like enzyme